jgi:uncharacterized protein
MRGDYDRAGLIALIKSQFKLDWHGVHGANHWARVLHHGKNIGQIRKADLLVVELFGFLHDSCRWDDYRDPKQLDTLCYALKHHSGGEVSSNKTIQTCWDADRLDLGRVGIFPSPQFLSQEANIFIDLAYDWSTQAPRRSHG